MKKHRLCLLLLFVVLLPYSIMSASVRRPSSDSNGTLTIKADGSSTLQSSSAQPRVAMEQQVRSWEQWTKRAQKEEEEEGNDQTPSASSAEENEAETKPMDDKELESRLRAIYANAQERAGDESPVTKLDSIEVGKDTVTLVNSQHFESLEQLLERGYSVFASSGLWFQNVRFEIDGDGKLRITLTPYEEFGKNVGKEWKAYGARTEMKIVLPGKVISSGFPNSQDNATWVAIDGKDTNTVNTLSNLYSAPIVITAEPAGLNIPQPLEAKTLQRASRRNVGEHEDVPVTDARTGFVVESTTITTSAVQYFGEGEAVLKKAGHHMEPAGVKIRAKMFPPKGSTIKSVSEVRVINAVDDKNRQVVSVSSDAEDSYVPSFSSHNEGKSADLELRLQLPSPDASSIDELDAEAVALTVGTWKEFILTNAPALTNKEIDLAEIMPGAKATVTKASVREGQFSVQVKLVGPKTAKKLELELRLPGVDDLNSHTSERSSSTKSDQLTRTVTVQGYAFGSELKTEKNIDLVFKLPQEVRRERVKFKLTALDLF